MNIAKAAKQISRVFRNTQTRKFAKARVSKVGKVATKIGAATAIGSISGAGSASFTAPAHGRKEARREGLLVGGAYGAAAMGGGLLAGSKGGLVFRRIKGRIVAMKRKF